MISSSRYSRLPVLRSFRLPRPIYDLLPMTLPTADVVTNGKEWFERWLRLAIAASDNLVCISRSVADEVIGYIEQNALGRHGLKVGWWHLGAKPFVAEGMTNDIPRQDATKAPYALMVGTVEPRKNHALALDAFEKLWANGVELNLVIVGKPGWLVDELLQRLRKHPKRNTKLFFLEQTTDAEIRELYRHAAMLLMVSKGEGFGLPIVEARSTTAFLSFVRISLRSVKLPGTARLMSMLAAWMLFTVICVRRGRTLRPVRYHVPPTYRSGHGMKAPTIFSTLCSIRTGIGDTKIPFGPERTGQALIGALGAPGRRLRRSTENSRLIDAAILSQIVACSVAESGVQRFDVLSFSP